MQQNIRRRLENLREYRCECSKDCWRVTLRRNVFIILLVFSVVFGIILGAALRTKTPWTEEELIFLRFPGTMLLQMLKMVMLPLIIASVISGVSNLNRQSAGKIGGRAVLYYFSTMFIAVALGIILVVSIKPGHHESVIEENDENRRSVGHSFLDLIRDCFPENIFAATMEKTVTESQPISKTPTSPNNSSNETATKQPPVQYVPVVTRKPGKNILGLVVFSVIFSIAINTLEDQGRVVRQFFDAVNDAIHKIVSIIIWYTPIGIIFLISSKVVGMKNPYAELTQVGKFIATVSVGLLIHFFIILPAIYVFFIRKNPYKFLYGMSEAIIIALATASSSATMPVTLRCVKEKNKIDRRIAKFVISVGTSVNMDGTALYEAVASIFIAQINGISLDPGQIIVIRDRLRTSTNVWGDAIGAAIVEWLSQEDLNDPGNINGGDLTPRVDQDGDLNDVVVVIEGNREEEAPV